jgi:hypothetical protein
MRCSPIHSLESGGSRPELDRRQPGAALHLQPARTPGVPLARRHPGTGAVRVIAEEAPKTFVDWTAKTYLDSTESAGEALWMSERDGWCHLWRIRHRADTVMNQITRGPWIVRQVERVDEAGASNPVLRRGRASGAGPVLPPPLPGRLRRLGPARPHRGRRHAARSASRPESTLVPRHLAARGPAAGHRASPGLRWTARPRDWRAGRRHALLRASGWTVPERFVAHGTRRERPPSTG